MKSLAVMFKRASSKEARSKRGLGLKAKPVSPLSIAIQSFPFPSQLLIIKRTFRGSLDNWASVSLSPVSIFTLSISICLRNITSFVILPLLIHKDQFRADWKHTLKYSLRYARQEKKHITSSLRRNVTKITPYCESSMTLDKKDDILNTFSDFNRSVLQNNQGWTPRPAPRKNRLPRPAPPRPAKSRPCPAPPRKIDEIRGAQRGKTDCRFHWYPFPLCPRLMMP